MNLDNEIITSKKKIKDLQNQLHQCKNMEKERHLAYLLGQEEIKLENFELLRNFSTNIRGRY